MSERTCATAGVASQKRWQFWWPELAPAIVAAVAAAEPPGTAVLLLTYGAYTEAELAAAGRRARCGVLLDPVETQARSRRPAAVMASH